MVEREFRLNMDMMYGVHDALRRDLAQVVRIAKNPEGSTSKYLLAVQGWEIFRKFLEVHHISEDNSIWPAVRAHAAGNTDQLALVDEMEAEHSAIDPLLAAVAEAAADAENGPKILGDRVDELATAVTKHLSHEEAEGLDILDALLTEEEWVNFSKVHRERIGDDRVLYLPWLLEEASERTVKHIFETFPPPLISALESKWGVDYAALNRWEESKAAS
jgi:hemerythrin-like domain-containing protein